jgi:hypothetical protein
MQERDRRPPTRPHPRGSSATNVGQQLEVELTSLRAGQCPAESFATVRRCEAAGGTTDGGRSCDKWLGRDHLYARGRLALTAAEPPSRQQVRWEPKPVSKPPSRLSEAVFKSRVNAVCAVPTPSGTSGLVTFTRTTLPIGEEENRAQQFGTAGSTNGVPMRLPEVWPLL